MSDPTDTRLLTPVYNEKGSPEWKSMMSPPDKSIAVIHMVPDRIIPVIFVPGVMGSNLKEVGVQNGQRWRLDSESSMISWMSKNAADRKKYLTKDKMEVDDGGEIPEGTEQNIKELRRRGWGSVGALSYSTFLVWLENSLNDFNFPKNGAREILISKKLNAMKGEVELTRDEVALSYKYKFPVYAFGYNWLDDCSNSSLLLSEKISEIIVYHKKNKEMCVKVIIVSHSMGG